MRNFLLNPPLAAGLTECVICLKEDERSNLLEICPQGGHRFHVSCVRSFLCINKPKEFHCMVCRRDLKGIEATRVVLKGRTTVSEFVGMQSRGLKKASDNLNTALNISAKLIEPAHRKDKSKPSKCLHKVIRHLNIAHNNIKKLSFEFSNFEESIQEVIQIAKNVEDGEVNYGDQKAQEMHSRINALVKDAITFQKTGKT